jgi:hypothetical protein
MLAPSRLLPLLAIATLLATGCCCPQLSGRYCHPACHPAGPPPDTAAFDANNGEACCPHGGGHCWGLRSRLAALFGIGGEGVPSQQGPDYASPQPKFHPVPTHPVFEPQFTGPPPQLIEPAGSNPLRSSYHKYGTSYPAAPARSP